MKKNSKSKQLPRGVIIPIVTPFDNQGKIDDVAMDRLIAHCLQGGAHGIFVLGSTGEFCSMSKSRRREVLKSASSHVRQKAKLFVGISSCCLSDACEESRLAAELGADYVVSTVPYYQLYSQDDNRRYFRVLADTSPLPLILYNIPERTGVTLETETILSLSEHPNIVGLKETSPDLTNFIALCDAMAGKGHFALFNGKENSAAISLVYGASGLVPACAQVAPRLFRDLYDMTLAGDIPAAIVLQRSINRLYTLLTMGRAYHPGLNGFLIALKTALNLLGLCSTNLAQLNVAVTDTFRNDVAQFLQSCGLILAEESYETSSIDGIA